MHARTLTHPASVPTRGTPAHSAAVAAAAAATLPAVEVKLGRMAAPLPPTSQVQRILECSLVWDSTELNNGSLRQRMSQLGRLGHNHMQLKLTSSCKSDDVPTPELIRVLGVVYDTLSEIEPRTIAVPLAPCAGENNDHLQSAQQEPAIVATFADAMPAEGMPTATEHIVLPPPSGPPPGVENIQPPVVLPAGAPDASQVVEQVLQDGQPAPDSSAGQSGASMPQLLFDHVAVGGTFDRLHCGHELLLASTALVARKRAYVGVTADKLLVNKNHKELLQPYEQRRDAAVKFMQAVRPSLQIEAGALSDPHEPTQAEVDPNMQAIVVSQETLPGALKINEGRAARGFAPLLILVVPVIGSKDPGKKLSSTQLRAQDAAAKTAAKTAAIPVLAAI